MIVVLATLAALLAQGAAAAPSKSHAELLVTAGGGVIPPTWLPMDAERIEYLLTPRPPKAAAPADPATDPPEKPKVSTVKIAVFRAAGHDEAQVAKLREDLVAGRAKERELLFVLAKQKPALRVHGQGCALDNVAQKAGVAGQSGETYTFACRAVSPLPPEKPADKPGDKLTDKVSVAPGPKPALAPNVAPNLTPSSKPSPKPLNQRP
jgi:hypothetical protein